MNMTYIDTGVIYRATYCQSDVRKTNIDKIIDLATQATK